LITPDQSITPVLSTSEGFYNSFHTSKREVGIFYLKLLSPIDLRSMSRHFSGGHRYLTSFDSLFFIHD